VLFWPLVIRLCILEKPYVDFWFKLCFGFEFLLTENWWEILLFLVLIVLS